MPVRTARASRVGSQRAPVGRRDRGMSPAARRITSRRRPRGRSRRRRRSERGRRPAASSGASATAWASLAYSFFERPRQHLERGHDDLGLPVPLAGVVVPLARLKASLDVDQLALRQELAGDLGQAIPGHARVVLGPLVVAAAVLVRCDREGRDVLVRWAATAAPGPGSAVRRATPCSCDGSFHQRSAPEARRPLSRRSLPRCALTGGLRLAYRARSGPAARVEVVEAGRAQRELRHRRLLALELHPRDAPATHSTSDAIQAGSDASVHRPAPVDEGEERAIEQVVGAAELALVGLAGPQVGRRRLVEDLRAARRARWRPPAAASCRGRRSAPGRRPCRRAASRTRAAPRSCSTCR